LDRRFFAMGFFAWGFAMVFIFCFATLLLAAFFVSVVLREDDEDDVATVELEMEVPPPCC
jgi:hypothetical protein